MSAPDRRRLHDCLDSVELCEAIDASARGRGATWSVAIPGSAGQFSVLLSGEGTSTGPVDGEAAALLETLFRRDEGLAPLSSPRALRSGEPAVAAASPLSFRNEKYGLFLLHGDGL